MTFGIRRNRCISCGEPLPGDIVLVGDQYPSAIFLEEGAEVPEELVPSSLNLTRCDNNACALVQLAHEYDLQYVFDHYPYESGSTATMGVILKEVVADALDVVQVGQGDVVLDVGGNDGTLLSLVDRPVRALVNIDAAAGIRQVVDAPNYHHVHARFSADTYRNLGLQNPRLITSVAMFYHLNNPLGFCRQVAEVMSDDTVWVLQMTYFGTMLRDNILDNIVHEHVAYYSLHSVEALLKRVGLAIAEARIVPSYGGSLRLFIVKDPARFPSSAYRIDYPGIQQFERDNRTNSFEALYAFNSRAELIRSSLRELIVHLSRTHGPIWGFGASTKGNMLLQFLGIDSGILPVILDNSDKKIGSRTTGSLIPIVDESQYLREPPPYLLILPYYYTEAFERIVRKKLPSNASVNFLVPLPHPRFISVGARS